MVQRKDSLAYVEFLRGKYDLQNPGYICTLLSNMTQEERACLVSKDFETLWNALWSPNGYAFVREFTNAKHKFELLSKGYYVRGKGTKDKSKMVRHIALRSLVETTTTGLHETEWGFPKGRRNFFEDDKRCALRELREETGVNLGRIRIIREFKPIEEIFSGTNKMRYKHVYYVARYQCSSDRSAEVLFDPDNKHQAREVKAVRWFTYADAQDKINEMNVERKELLKRVNNMVIKTNVAAI